MNRSFILRFMTIYFGIFLVAFAMSVPLYQISIQNNRDAIVKEQSRLVVQGSRELSVHLDAGNQIARNLALQPEMVRLSLADDSSEKLPILMYNARRVIQSQIWMNPIIYDIVITFPNNGVVVTQSTIYNDKETFYRQFFTYADMDYDSWQRELDNESPGWTGTVLANGIHATPVVTYNFYSSNLFHENIIVSLVIDLGQVRRYLVPGELAADGWLVATDPSLGTVLALGEPGGDGYIPLGTDAEGRLSVSAAISKGMVERSVRSQRDLLLLYAGVAILVAAGISLAAAFRQTRPLQKLYEAVQSHSGREVALKASYEGMLQGLEGIIGSQLALRGQYEEVSLLHQRMLLDMALHGAPLDGEMEELEELAVFAEDYIVGIAMSDKRELRSDALMVVLEEELSGAGIYLQVIQEKVLLLLPRNALSGDRELELLAAARERAVRQQGGQIYFGLSTIKSGLSQAAKGFSEAGAALRHAIRDQSLFEVYTARMTSVQPEIDQAKLWEIMQRGSAQEVQAWFRALGAQNEYITDPVTGAMQYYTIVSVLQRMSLRLASQGATQILPYRQSLPADENFRALEELALQLQREIGIQQGEGKKQIVDKAADYIKANFRDPGLSLAALAGELGLSERYISGLIAERYGASYQELVTRLRIDAAISLLTETAGTVSEIAASCGYENDNTFYKAFRKAVGVSPSAYRRAARKQPDR